jgi:hypothetical protein
VGYINKGIEIMKRIDQAITAGDSEESVYFGGLVSDPGN